MKLPTLLVLVVALGLFAAACNAEEAELSTTTSVITGTTGAPEQDDSTTTTEEQSDTTTSTTLVGETVANHEVVERISTDNGEILHIVIPEGAYTDVDLVNFIGDLKESDPDLWGVEVFDDPAAVEAFTVAEADRTEEQETLLEDHHFLTLTNGDRVIFRGPFSEFGEFILAS